jgi:hypothetical protein
VEVLANRRQHDRIIAALGVNFPLELDQMVPWLIAALLILGLLGLNITFVLAARAIRKDMTKRFDELQRRLESRANSIVDNIFDANQS